MGPTPTTPETKFWSRVHKTAECWLWTGAPKSNGYGQFTVLSGESGYKKVFPHRFSYELHHGPIPKGMHVCHHCDVPACVNPAHLFLGTPADNLADMRAKGRQEHGERHHWSKLTDAQVSGVRAAFSAGESKRDIAARYGVTRGCIHYIVIRRNRAIGAQP
jgi:hypothetical protein